MINNTPTSVNNNDDYGAVGVVIANQNNVVSYNKMQNCKAASYDYGTDGGTVELWENASGSNIHHKLAINNDGFMEAGSDNKSPDDNVIIAYNVSINTGDFIGLHSDATFGITVSNLKILNNTVYNSTNSGSPIINFWPTPPTSNILTLENNIFSTGSDQVTNTTNFTHDHNLYNSSPGFSLTSTEILANPKFVNPAANDLHLQSGSPAIAKGINLGYTIDIDNIVVPSIPDIGAYQYTSGLSSTPTPVPSQIVKIGDANLDGLVNNTDFTIWLTNYSQTTTQGAKAGDFNLDTKVDGIDYVEWLNNFGK